MAYAQPHPEPQPEDDAPMDILARKHYYSELISSFEDIKLKRESCIVGIQEDEQERARLEAEIQAVRKRLGEVTSSIQKKTDKLREQDRTLKYIESSTLTDEALLRMLQRAKRSSAENAKMFRQELQADVEKAQANNLTELSCTNSGGHRAVVSKDMVAQLEGTRKVPVRCYRGKDVASLKNAAPGEVPPALVFFHGEGYAGGDLDTHDWVCRQLATLIGAYVVSVDYRRAPEHRFPAAFNDSYVALSWVAAGGMGAPPSRIAVAGDCAGGGLAAACCLRARDAGDGLKIAAQILFYPWLDVRPDAPVLKEKISNGRFGLSREDLNWFRDIYGPRGARGRPPPKPAETKEDKLATPEAPLWFDDARASPLVAESFARLPRAFIAYATDDPLASDATRYAERLQRDGRGLGAAHTLRVPGQRHGFVKLSDRFETQATLTAAAAFASAALHGQAPPTPPPEPSGDDDPHEVNHVGEETSAGVGASQATQPLRQGDADAPAGLAKSG